MLDAARSARVLAGRSASNTVIIVGYSQGGQAALFASQIADAYAPELFIAGVAALAPVTSLDQLAPATPKNRADGGAKYTVMALYAWSATYGDVPLEAELTPAAVRDTTAIVSACTAAVATPLDTTPTSRLFRPGWSFIPALRARHR